MPQDVLEHQLAELRAIRKKLIKDLDSTDTEMIGIKLELDRRKIISDIKLQSERDADHSQPYDE